MTQTLTCSVVRVEDQTVHLQTPDGQSLTLPLSAVHGTPLSNGTIRLLGVVVEGGQVDDSAFAKTILNELLSPRS